MIDDQYQRFIDGTMSDAEEEAFVAARPDVRRAIDLSMYSDGELPTEKVAEVEEALAESQEMQADLAYFQTLATAIPDRTKTQPTLLSWSSAWAACNWLFDRTTSLVPATVAPGLVLAGLTVVTAPQIPTGLTIALRAGTARTLRAGPSRDASRAVPGQILQAIVPRGKGTRTVLRIYLRGFEDPVASCPGSKVCADTAHSLQAEVTLNQRGTYDIVWIATNGPITEAQGSADDDWEAHPSAVVFETEAVEVY